MKTLYLECGMGAAGDMFAAALMELLPNPDPFIQEMNELGIPGVFVKREGMNRCGIDGSHFAVFVHGQEEKSLDYHAHEHHHDHEQHHGQGYTHSHNGMHEIEHLVRDHLNLPEKVKDDIMAVYGLIAEAESHAHGVPVNQIHFHEVGNMDAVADITAACLLMHKLNPDKVIASPIHVGSGYIHCAHGILPVPAPATAYILKDVPTYGGSIKGELCTPTGAALLKYFADDFGEMPVMKAQAVGYGMGKKDFGMLNALRAFYGEEEGASEDLTDEILELSCNVDDMTGEEVGFAMEQLFEAGAVDVITIPIGMKKSRPGIMIQVFCKEEKKEQILEAMFQYTTTLGIREVKNHRYILNRENVTVNTPYGEIRKKESKGYGVRKSKFEYEDIARVARKLNISFSDAKSWLEN